MRVNNQRSEFFVNLVDQVSKLPILAVIGTVIQVYRNNSPLDPDELETATGNFRALCPFHPDEHLGSFVITQTAAKNMWFCFTDAFKYCCSTVIDFEERYFEFWNPDWDDTAREDYAEEKSQAFKQAVFHLARRFDLISEEEYKHYSVRKIDTNVIHHVQKQLENSKKKMTEIKKADQDVIDMVYSCMARVCRLSPAHEKHLKRERRLRDDDLADYFTFPTRKFFLAQHICQEAMLTVAKRIYENENREISSLKDLSDSEKTSLKATPELTKLAAQFPFVPGFFYNCNKDGRYIDFCSYTGIGFLVKDDEGHINGIQVRRDKINPGESRYVWFSSAFAQTKENCQGGVSCGSPGGIIFSKKKGNEPVLCITEGRFKAEQIAKCGNDAVYISGVSTWSSVLGMIDRVKGNRNMAFIMFDADMMGNVAVHSQLSDIAKELYRHKLYPILILWPKDRGKGFDDLVIGSGESYYKKLKYVPYNKFEPLYQKVLSETLESFDVKHVKDIPKDERTIFNTLMQKNVESAVGLNQ